MYIAIYTCNKRMTTDELILRCAVRMRELRNKGVTETLRVCRRAHELKFGTQGP